MNDYFKRVGGRVCGRSVDWSGNHGDLRMKVYSPTQTDLFAFCPQARQFYKEGWQPRIADKPQIAAWMGIAMGAGLEVYYNSRITGAPPVISPELAGANSWGASLDVFRRAGGVVEDADIVAVPGLLAKALGKYPKVDPIPDTWRILATEYELPNSGRARLDLVVETEHGVAAVDFKWKKELWTKAGESKDQARGRTLLEYENYWNMLHYFWGLRQEYGKGHIKDQAFDPAYYIILGELNPVHAQMQRFEVDPRVLEQWERTAKGLWAEMDANDFEYGAEGIGPRGNTTHENKYGKCKYYDACFTHFLNRETMPLKYVQIERVHDTRSV